jgi:hypothetical protein
MSLTRTSSAPKINACRSLEEDCQRGDKDYQAKEVADIVKNMQDGQEKTTKKTYGTNSKKFWVRTRRAVHAETMFTARFPHGHTACLEDGLSYYSTYMAYFPPACVHAW